MCGNIKNKARKIAIRKLIRDFGDTCWYCGCSLTKETRTIEHIVARSMGGKNRLDNLRLACDYCNKTHKNPREAHLRPKKPITKLEFYWQKQKMEAKRDRKNWVGACFPIA
jgi:5-methylcytosine-specific restriction endonuclease McrA